MCKLLFLSKRLLSDFKFRHIERCSYKVKYKTLDSQKNNLPIGDNSNKNKPTLTIHSVEQVVLISLIVVFSIMSSLKLFVNGLCALIEWW